MYKLVSMEPASSQSRSRKSYKASLVKTTPPTNSFVSSIANTVELNNGGMEVIYIEIVFPVWDNTPYYTLMKYIGGTEPGHNDRMEMVKFLTSLNLDCF